MRAAELIFETLMLRPRLPAPALADEWRRVSPRGLAELIEFEGASIWMLRRLREIGADGVAPQGFVQGITARARDDAARNLLADAEAAKVLGLLEAAGVPYVLIKGTARRAAAHRWLFADARSTHDVDLIVPAARAAQAWDRLTTAGYRQYADGPSPSPHQLPSLVGEGRVSVDLHTSLGRTLPPAEAWRRASEGSLDVEWRGARVRIPCATELLWHGLTHAVLQNGLHAWRLRFLLDCAAILAGTDAIQWDRLFARLAEAEVDSVAGARWLGAASALAGVASPVPLRGSGGPFDVRLALGWRRTVLARGGDRGFTGRLLEEGTRAEIGLGVAPTVEGVGRYRQTRRWIAGRVARAAYRAWRATSWERPA